MLLVRRLFRHEGRRIANHLSSLTGPRQAHPGLLYVRSPSSSLCALPANPLRPRSRCNECVEAFATEPELRQRFELEQAETAAKLKEMGIEL